jgi:hypothetical protein
MVDTTQYSTYVPLHNGKSYIYLQTSSALPSYLANSMNFSTAQMFYHGQNVQLDLHYVFPSA